MGDHAEALVRRARSFTDLPIAVGFGVSKREDILRIWKYADAVVVGSAIVREIERASSPENALTAVHNYAVRLLNKNESEGSVTNSSAV